MEKGFGFCNVKDRQHLAQIFLDLFFMLLFFQCCFSSQTFTRWLNSKLGRESSFKVDDLDSDLKDGMALMTLLSRLFDDPSFLPKGSGSKNRIYQMNNMTEAFNRMKKRGIKLENIGPADIVDGNNKLILGLMWTLVCFSVEQSQLESGPSCLFSMHAPSSKLHYSDFSCLFSSFFSVFPCPQCKPNSRLRIAYVQILT